MALFRRSTPVPDAVRRTLDLAPGDKVLAGGELTHGGWAVASRNALHVTGETPRSRPWTDVDRAGFDPFTSTVTVEWIDDEPDLALTLADADRTSFPQMLRERIQSSVVIAETLAFPGDRTATVAVRRSADGDLFSQVSVDGGVDLGDPKVAARIDEAEARVRSASGLPL
ncbi:hypothetical protein GCM10025865_25480 [Paraoerskovia sediminicola]|uniref:Uncharacterized protein n=1 Tax=Paraoerskovia sediminicola TaxID=1138587 RepID=A0ABM8G5B2_9CELL|nr:hypothetical protein [Paraoerskovia sediminicola]BDZ43249.1 hypothetical protein GCM10025865_25480 [Paraoerskovia sediminicola]